MWKLFHSDIYENLLMALDTLRQHKLRSLLTILGVVVGTMTVIVIAAFVSGIDDRVSKEIESFGTNSIYAYRFDPGFNINPSAEERMRKPLSYEDALAVGAQCPSVAHVAPFISPVDFLGGPFVERINVRHRDIEMTNATVQGTLAAYFKMGVTSVAEGRYFTDEEDARRADVAVIGRDVANTLFPFSGALDRKILINGRDYRVVGVLAERETFLVGAEDPNNENKAVYLPYLTVKGLYPDADDNFIMAQAQPGKLKEALEEVREVLRRRRRVPSGAPDNFGVSTSDQIIEQFGAITGGVFALMVAISSVGLLIGGIGVMNIMLVSVTERTKEIGVRKAIGARRRDIVTQFLIEAATLTGLGGVLGILLGSGVALLIQTVMPTHIPLWAPVTGFVVSVALGVGFGLWPAWKAARLNPIDALRYE
ncbi:MAG TPA: ABC transporter permease [Pyrinomonadaceae bacterium]|jgi:ABC-type antimicrobial peptide transport system permease subunit|nr:ABC transporter permease [Pyrinomonadaceae bacterium]